MSLGVDTSYIYLSCQIIHLSHTDLIADQNTPPPVPPRSKRMDSFEKGLPPRLPEFAEQQPCSVPSYAETASAEDILPMKRKANLSEGMSLKKLVSSHSKSFPLRIHVLEGFSGHTSELTISTADEYNIHFTKHQTVVTVRASSGELYSIPINSAVQFGLLYKPEKQPKKQHIFKNVSDIIALKTLPKVVCATVAYVGESETASVAENEVLCIKRVHNPMFHGRKSLEVYSLSTGGKKQLPLECLGKFSTDPSLIRMCPSDMLDHVSSLFPSQAMMFTSEDFTRSVQELSTSLFSNHVTLTETKTETSLVASTVDTSIPLEQAENLIDIPLDDCLANVKVAIVHLDDANETERLQIDTQNLLKNIDLAKLQSYRDASSDNIYATQSLFYANLEKGCERIGVKLDAPSPMLSRGLPREERVPSPILSRGLHREERVPSPILSRGLHREERVPSPILSRGLHQEESVAAKEDIEFDGNNDYAAVSFPELIPSVPNYTDMQPVDIQQPTYEEPEPNESGYFQEYYATLNYDAKPPLLKEVETLPRQIKNLEAHFGSWKESQARAIKSIEERVEKLSKCFESLKAQFTKSSESSSVPQATRTSQMPPFEAGCSSVEKNKMFLQSMSVAQVRQLRVIR